MVYDGRTYNWGKFLENGAERWICMNYVTLDEPPVTPPEEEEPKGIPGDMDGNELVNEDDATYLLGHVLFPEWYPIEGNTDLNSDGELTEDDATYLLGYVLFPEWYPLP